MFAANLVPLLIGALVFLFGPVAVKILERLLGNAPSRLWRLLAFLCVLAGWTIVLLNEPAITQVKLHPKIAIGSTVAVIGVSLLLVRSKLFDSPSDRVRLSGRIICREAALVLNAKEKFYDCFFVLQLKVTNDGLPTMVSRWQLDLYWEGVEYPSVRQSVAGYHVKVPSSHANDLEINFETRPLTEFPHNEEITTANYKIGWVRFKVGVIPANAVGDFQRLRREVVLKLQAFDSKDNSYLIYEGSIEDLSGCGTIERPDTLGSLPRSLQSRRHPVEIGRESELALNILPLPVDDNLAVELDRREVFHRSQHDFALHAITAKFVNQSKSSGGIGTAEGVGARVLIYEAVRLDVPIRTIDYVCWLDHEEPLIDFPCDAPQRIVLAVFEPKPTGGFEPRVTFYGNHTDPAMPLDRYEYSKPYEHLCIEVILYGVSYWYELEIQYGISYSFESFTERDNRLSGNIPIASSISQLHPLDKLRVINQLGAFRDEGNELLERLSIHRVMVPYEQEFEAWRKRVQEYLEGKSHGYATRFRSKSIEYKSTTPASTTTRPLVDMLYTCIMRLEDYIRELSR